MQTHNNGADLGSGGLIHKMKKVGGMDETRSKRTKKLLLENEKRWLISKHSTVMSNTVRIFDLNFILFFGYFKHNFYSYIV